MQTISRFLGTAVAAALLSATPVIAQSPAPASNNQMLTIVSPQEGQTIYGDRVPMLFAVDENFQILDPTNYPTNAAGQGHIHVWLDDQNPTKESAKKVFEDNTIYSDVPPGDHTLKAELVNNNHTSLPPAQVVTVSFKTAPVGSPAPAPSPTFDKNTAIVILVVVALVIIAAWWYTKDEEETSAEETSSKKPAARKTTRKKSTSKSRRK